MLFTHKEENTDRNFNVIRPLRNQNFLSLTCCRTLEIFEISHYRVPYQYYSIKKVSLFRLGSLKTFFSNETTIDLFCQIHSEFKVSTDKFIGLDVLIKKVR